MNERIFNRTTLEKILIRLKLMAKSSPSDNPDVAEVRGIILRRFMHFADEISKEARLHYKSETDKHLMKVYAQQKEIDGLQAQIGRLKLEFTQEGSNDQ